MSINMNELVESTLLDVKLRTQAGIALHKTLVNNASLPSCINCDHFEITNEYCKKFDAHPPAETIVFSCGVANWDALIPF